MGLVQSLDIISLLYLSKIFRHHIPYLSVYQVVIFYAPTIFSRGNGGGGEWGI